MYYHKKKKKPAAAKKSLHTSQPPQVAPVVGLTSPVGRNVARGNMTAHVDHTARLAPKVPVSQLTPEERVVEHYQIMERIGKGGFGAVYKGLDTITGGVVAIKRVDLRGLSELEIQDIEMEFKLLEKLKHKNIVSYIANIQAHGFLHIILELCTGAVASTLRSLDGRPSEQLLAHYTKETLDGLKYLHEQGVVHRDIKGANILTDQQGHVKITDFGVATKLGDVGGFEDAAGTPYWMAPEIISMSQQSPACDIWSLGSTVIELLTGKPPYFDVNPLAALYVIVSEDMPLPEGISASLSDFLQECFQKDPNRRITAAGLLKHPWIKTNCSGDGARKANSTKAGEKSEALVDRDHVVDIGLFADEQDAFDLDEEGIGDISIKSNSNKKPGGPAGATEVFEDLDAGWESDPFGDVFEEPDDADRLAKERAKTVASFKQWVADLSRMGKDLSAINAQFHSARESPGRKRSLAAPLLNPVSVALDEGPSAGYDPVLSGQKTPLNEEFHNTCVKMLAALRGAVDDLELWKDLCEAAVLTIVDLLMELAEHEHELLGSECADLLDVLGCLLNPSGSKDEKDHFIGEDVMATLEMMGVVPAVLHLGELDVPTAIRTRAAHIIIYFLLNTRNAFVACGGLGVLPALLVTDYEDAPSIVHIGIDCLEFVFKVGRPSKPALCKFFAKAGLLAPLTGALRALHEARRKDPKKGDVVSMKKLVDMFGTFTRSAHTTQKSFPQEVVEPVVSILATLDRDMLIELLRCVVAIATKGPVAVDELEAGGAMAVLVGLLQRAQATQEAELEKEVLIPLFHMAKIKVSRLKAAAESGIIPCLIRLVEGQSGLKMFALPILFAIAKAQSTTCRNLFKRENGVDFLMGLLLSERYHSMDALEALQQWLQDERPKSLPADILHDIHQHGTRQSEHDEPGPRAAKEAHADSEGPSVEEILSSDQNVLALLSFFESVTGMVQFERIMSPYERILSLSEAITVKLCLVRNGAFIGVLIDRLKKWSDNNKNNNICVSIMKMLAVMYDKHPDSSVFSSVYDLAPLLKDLENSSSVIVRQRVEYLSNKMIPRTRLQKLLQKKTGQRTLHASAKAALLGQRVESALAQAPTPD